MHRAVIDSLFMSRKSHERKSVASGGHRQILFANENLFTVEEKLNRQNDRIYARSPQQAAEKIGEVRGGHHLASVMI